MRYENDITKNPWLLALAAIVVLSLAQLIGGAALRAMPTSFWRGGVQAVFLANGQVYFGKIGIETERAVVMSDIYYLKLAKPVVSQDDLQAQDATSLVKLGNELHGPQDRMEIPREQILYIERLKADSKVAKAIEQYHTQGATK